MRGAAERAATAEFATRAASPASPAKLATSFTIAANFSESAFAASIRSKKGLAFSFLRACLLAGFVPHFGSQLATNPGLSS